MYVRLKWLPWMFISYLIYVYFQFMYEIVISVKQVSPEEGCVLFVQCSINRNVDRLICSSTSRQLFTPIFEFSKLDFQLLHIVTLLSLDQLTWSLTKNVTTFHGQQEGIIHFCLSPNKRGVLAIWKKLINQVWKSPLSF